MGKFVNAIIMVLMIEVGLYLFAGVEYTSSTATALLDLVLNPGTTLTSSFFTNLLTNAALGITAGAVIVVGIVTQSYSFVVYGIMAIAIGKFVQVLVGLSRFISGPLVADFPEFVLLANVIIIGPLIVYFIMACVEWARGNN